VIALSSVTSSIFDDLYPDLKDTPTGTLPWSDDLRGDDKTRIFRYLLNIPSGVPVTTLVEHLFAVNPDSDEQEYQRHYKFTERFVDECPVLKIDRRQQATRCEARPAAFHLTSHKHNSNTTAVGRLDNNSGDDGEQTSVRVTPTEASLDQYPRDFAQNFISGRGMDEMTPDRATVLESQFVSYLEQIDGRWNILKNINGNHPEYLLAPYKTLYNSSERVDDNWRRYHVSWQNATEEYSNAVQITLTTDPKRFDSLQEMADATSENFNRFMSWCRRRLANRCEEVGTDGHRIGECPHCEEFADRPDYVKALEWTDAGRPHLHVILFGINWLAPQREIADQWSKYQAAVVDVRSVKKKPVRNGDGISVGDHEFAWFSNGNSDDKDAQKNEKAHMGKYLGEQMPANESISVTRQRVEDDDDHLWKTAMFWATQKRFWSCSQDLKPSTGEDKLEELPEYVFVGAAKDGDIPKHVWETSVKMIGCSRGKDPPPDQ